VEWTPFGVSAVKDRGFTYLSAEFSENFIDNEKQQPHGCTLLGAGLTIRPVIKNLDPVQLSEVDNDHDPAPRICISHALLAELSKSLTQEPGTMNYLDQLKAKLLALGLSDAIVTKLLAEAKKQLEAETDNAKKDAIVLAWEETGKTLQAELKKLSASSDPGNVTITLAAPQSIDVNSAIEKALSARETAAATAKATTR
jgi:hypothetical protein